MRNYIDSEMRTIVEMFGPSKKKETAKFVIPDFQRPYSWKKEQVQALLDDLTTFAESDEKEYFLGTVVMYSEDWGQTYNLVDGQQRFTTLYLIFRNLHRYIRSLALVDTSEINTRERLLGILASFLWEEHARTGKYDQDRQRFETNVISEDQKHSLALVLETGEPRSADKSAFQRSYLVIDEYFKEIFDQKSFEYVVEYCYKLLESVWLIAIETETFESAMQIFETVNARGMRLENHDMYKSRIYKALDGEQARKEFTDFWLETSQRIEALPRAPYNRSIGVIFEIYAHYLAAKDQFLTTSMSYAKRYFSSNDSSYLKQGYELGHYETIADFLEIVLKREFPESETGADWWCQDEIMTKLDLLQEYYTVSPLHAAAIFHLARKDSPDFIKEFNRFLESLVSLVLSAIFNGYSSSTLNATFLNINRRAVEPEFQVLDTYLDRASKETIESFTRKKNVNQGGSWRKDIMLVLKVLGYDHKSQQGLLPMHLEREHIVPMKWSRGYLLSELHNELSRENANAILGNLGNVTLFEKTLNVRASNDFFPVKKREYQKSEVAMTRDLGFSSQEDFNAVDIENRRRAMVDDLDRILDSSRAFNQ